MSSSINNFDSSNALDSANALDFANRRPRTMKALNRVRKERLTELDCKMTRVLRARTYKLLEAGVEPTVSALVGVTNFNLVFRKKRLPCLQGLLSLAGRLDMMVDLIATRYSDGGTIPSIATGLGTKLNRRSLLAFMERLSFDYESTAVSREMAELIRIQLKLMECERTPIYWSNLIAFSAACGYKLSIWLSDNSRPVEPELLSRLDYPG